MSSFMAFRRRLSQIPLLFSPPPELRRAHTRFTVNLPIKVRAVDDDETLSRIAVDVSDGGLFFEPSMDVSIGTVIEVSVGLFLRDARATIVCHRGNGSALVFDSPAHGAAIRAWLTEIAMNDQGESGAPDGTFLPEQAKRDQAVRG